MHDPEFDGYLSKKPISVLPRPQPRSGIRSHRSRLQAFPRWWPVSRSVQAIFAEAFRQGLGAGLAVDHAVRLAAGMTPSLRFRQALWEMAADVRAGQPLDVALAKTGIRVQPGLLTCLRTGEEHNCLDVALATFAKHTGHLTSRHFYRKIGRSPEAIQFAASLSVLLRDHRLTVHEVRAAGGIAAGGGRKFTAIIQDVARRMEDGASLGEALRRHPGSFDRLYLELLESTRSRAEMRTCLERLGREDLA